MHACERTLCGRYLGAAGQQCTHHVYDAHQRALPSTEPNALLEQGKRQGSARLRVCGVGNEIDGRVARSVGHAHHQAPPICMAGLPLNKGMGRRNSLKICTNRSSRKTIKLTEQKSWVLRQGWGEGMVGVGY